MIKMPSEKYKKYIAPSGWYELQLPDVWESEQGQDCLSLCDSTKSFGVLQVSVHQFPQDENVNPKNELIEYLKDQDFKYAPGDIKTSNLNGKEIAEIKCVDQQEQFWKIWFIVQNNKMFFLTYNCDLKDKDSEIQTIEEIVKSIKAN